MNKKPNGEVFHAALSFPKVGIDITTCGKQVNIDEMSTELQKNYRQPV